MEESSDVLLRTPPLRSRATKLGSVRPTKPLTRLPDLPFMHGRTSLGFHDASSDVMLGSEAGMMMYAVKA